MDRFASHHINVTPKLLVKTNHNWSLRAQLTGVQRLSLMFNMSLSDTVIKKLHTKE